MDSHADSSRDKGAFTFTGYTSGCPVFAPLEGSSSRHAPFPPSMGASRVSHLPPSLSIPPQPQTDASLNSINHYGSHCESVHDLGSGTGRNHDRVNSCAPSDGLPQTPRAHLLPPLNFNAGIQSTHHSHSNSRTNPHNSLQPSNPTFKSSFHDHRKPPPPPQSEQPPHCRPERFPTSSLKTSWPSNSNSYSTFQPLITTPCPSYPTLAPSQQPSHETSPEFSPTRGSPSSFGKKRPAPYTPAQSYTPLPPGPFTSSAVQFGSPPNTYKRARAPSISTDKTKSEYLRITDIISADTIQATSTRQEVVNSQQPGKLAGNMEPKNKKGMYQGAHYSIHVRQQPIAARSCGFGERDRRAIDPPPIVQMEMTTDPPLKPGELNQRMYGRGAVMYCSIWDKTGKVDCSAMPADPRPQRRLMGTVVASPFVAKDENGEEGCFFCFPDLSCRTPGVFKLMFSFVIVDPRGKEDVRSFPILGHVFSSQFTVYNAKEFPGMRTSTALTHCLRQQGCLISLKKGSSRGDNNQDGQEHQSPQGV